jgi:hypothetical protein
MDTPTNHMARLGTYDDGPTVGGREEARPVGYRDGLQASWRAGFASLMLSDNLLPRAHNQRISPSLLFPSPWPAHEPKQRPRRGSHCRRQRIKLLILRSSKYINGCRKQSQGIQSRKGGPGKRSHFQSREQASAPDAIAHVRLQSARRQ